MFEDTKDYPVKFPQMYKVRQKAKIDKIVDIKSEVVKELTRIQIANVVEPGQRVAIAVGSRGITNIKDILISLIRQLKLIGCEPFIAPSMGSHGNAKSINQKELLSFYGITEKSMQVPIEASMEVIKVGTVEEDFCVYVDKICMEADGIILVNRIKSHTDFKGEIESGLMKMMVIGMGNHKGCSSIHSRGSKMLSVLIQKAGRLILEKAPILMGLAIVENQFGDSCLIEAIMPEEIENREKSLLLSAKEKMAKLPVDKIDVLIVEEMGKNISGTGIDTNVIGRIRINGVEEPKLPDINKIVILGLTEQTKGSAVGMGLADIVTKYFYDEVDLAPTYTNCIAANCIERAFMPVIAKSNDDAVALAIKLTKDWEQEAVRLIKIKNTLMLDEMEVSKSVWEEVKMQDNIETINGPYNLKL